MTTVTSNNVYDLLSADEEPQEVDAEASKGAGNAPKKEGVRGGAKRGGAAGRGGAAARGGAAGGSRPPKHEFERHSAKEGSGKDSKKGGAGKYSWGSDAQAVTETEVAPIGGDVPAAAAAAGAEATPAAVEDKTVGLDDYYKQLNEKRPVEDLKIAPRAVISDGFKGKEFTKEEEQPYEDVVKERAERKKKEAKKKNVVSLDEWNAKHQAPAREEPAGAAEEPQAAPRREFDGERRGGRGRGGDGDRPRGRGGFRGGRGGDASAAPAGDAPQDGGRGGYRGRGGRGGEGRGRGRGGPRGGDRAGRGANFNINDDSAFPSLGK